APLFAELAPRVPRRAPPSRKMERGRPAVEIFLPPAATEVAARRAASTEIARPALQDGAGIEREPLARAQAAQGTRGFRNVSCQSLQRGCPAPQAASGAAADGARKASRPAPNLRVYRRRPGGY